MFTEEPSPVTVQQRAGHRHTFEEHEQVRLGLSPFGGFAVLPGERWSSTTRGEPDVSRGTAVVPAGSCTQADLAPAARWPPTPAFRAWAA